VSGGRGASRGAMTGTLWECRGVTRSGDGYFGEGGGASRGAVTGTLGRVEGRHAER
jgi:hypothetical protein